MRLAAGCGQGHLQEPQFANGGFKGQAAEFFFDIQHAQQTA
jgi:hypothetical protein